MSTEKIKEWEAEVADLRFRIKHYSEDRNDRALRSHYRGRIFQIADAKYFARLNHLKASGKPTTGDKTLDRLGRALDKAMEGMKS